MIQRVATIVFVLLSATFSAQAQFGPAEPTPRSAKEIYADRAMVSAASFLEARLTDVVDEQSGVDPERAMFWYSEAFEAYETLCNDKTTPRDAWARNCYKLGGLHLRGQGVPQSYTSAEHLFLQACEAGQHTDACLQQAYTDHRGSAGEPNWTQARRLYDIACQRGSSSGCAGLGNMLYRAQGGPPDRPRATRLLQDACGNDLSWACDRLTGFGLPQRSVR